LVELSEVTVHAAPPPSLRTTPITANTVMAPTALQEADLLQTTAVTTSAMEQPVLQALV
jgi:hypothetical protein